MKKLIAMIGAVATAFGLYAADFYGNSFESSDEGVSGETWGLPTLWSTTLQDAFKVGAYVGGELDGIYVTGAQRRDGSDEQQSKFLNGADNDKFLKLETGTNTLDRALTDLDTAGEKFYFDQLVKFTGFEEDPTFADGTKIAVWMSAIETEDYVPAVYDEGGELVSEATGTLGSTNLFVQVGTGAESIAVQIDPASVGLEKFAVDTWYRVTIKSIGNIIGVSGQDIESQLGFLVFINGKQASIVGKPLYHTVADALRADAAKYYAAGQLFTAMTEDTTLAKVGYQGIGAIDDVVLSASSPDFDMLVDVDFAPIDGAKVVSVTDSKGNVIPYADAEIKVAPGALTVTLKAAPGYVFYDDGVKCYEMNRSATATLAGGKISVTLGEDECVEAVAKIDDEYFGNLAEALVAVQELEKTQDSVVVEILGACDYTDEATETVLAFEDEATVTIGKGGIWEVEGDAAFVGCIGTEGLAKEVSVAGALAFVGTVSSGSTLVATTMVTEDAEVVLEADATVMTTTDISSIVKMAEGTPEDYELVIPETPDEEGYYTYQVKMAKTGFAIIIAEGNVKYFDTLQDAIDAAGTDDLPNTVTILEDCVLDARVTISGKTVTLAAGEEPVTVSCASDRVLDIRNNANVTIGQNVTLTTTAHPTVFIMGTETAKAAGDTTKSTLVVNGTIANTNPTFDATFTLCGNGDDYDGVDITIGANGVVSNANGAAIYFPNPGTLTVNGTVEGYSAIIIKDGELVVNNGATITATGANYYPLPTNTDGASPSGDAIVAGYYSQTYLGYGTPVIEIKGGTISVNPACEGAVGVQGYDYYTQVAPDDAKDNIEVAGGTFNAPVAEDYCASGYIPLDNGDGTYGVKEGVYVARVNGQQGYETLAEAVAAANDDDTVALIADCEVASLITVAKPITIDLNEKTITAKSATGVFQFTAAAAGFELKNGAIDSGLEAYAAEELIEIIDAAGNLTDLAIDSANYQYGVVATTAGEKDIMLTPFDGKVVCDSVSVTGGRSCLFYTDYIPMELIDCTAIQAGDIDHPDWYNCAVSAAWGATVTVKSGTYSAKYVLNEMSSPAKIVVEGGKFTGTVKDWGLDAVNYGDYGTHEWVISAGDFSDKEIPVAYIEAKDGMTAYWADSEIADYVTPDWAVTPVLPTAEVEAITATGYDVAAKFTALTKGAGYDDWQAKFLLTSDVAIGADEIMLGGQYEAALEDYAGGWIDIPFAGCEAGVPVVIAEDLDVTVADLFEIVNVFNCGVKNIALKNNAKFKLELVISDPEGVKADVKLCDIADLAVAAKTFDITFKVDGQDNIVSNDVVIGTAFAAVKPADPTAPEFKSFKGWTPVVETIDGTELEFTAEFTNNVYAITFAANGGSGEQAAIKYEVGGEAKTAPECTFSAPDNGKFNCWSNATDHATFKVGDTLPTNVESYELVADWTIEAPAPVIPVDDDKELDDKGKAAAEKTLEVFGDAAAVTTWANAVYADGKIPAEKLNATTEDLIKIAKEYNIEILKEGATAEIAQEADGAFSFQIKDADGAINLQPAVVAEKLLKMVEFTSDLGDATKPFATATAGDVTVAIKDGTEGKKATATFTKATTAGFMRVKLTVAE